jgi:flagellin-like protein
MERNGLIIRQKMLVKVKRYQGEKVKKLEQKGISPLVGEILLIAIVVILAAIIATLVGGLKARGVSPSALLSVTAVKTGTGSTYDLTISHEGGDTLSVSDLQVMASDNSNGGTGLQIKSFTYNGATTGTFSVGNSTTIPCSYNGNCENQVLTVYIIFNKPSKEKIFSSPTVAVSST